MSEKKIEGIVRDFREAFVKRDVEKMLSLQKTRSGSRLLAHSRARRS